VPLALIVFATVLAHSAFNGSRLTISLNALALGESPLTVGLLMSLFAALPMVLAVPAGRLIDRIGVGRPILAAAACLMLAVALPGVFPGIIALHVAAACIGTSFMLFHISVQHAVGEGSSPEERKANFGWLALGFSVSNFAGPTTAGFAIDTLGHARTFLLLSLAALTAFVALFLGRKSFPRLRHDAAGGERHSTFELLRNPELRRVFLITALLAAAWDIFVFVTPIYGNSIGLSASTIGLILGSFALATFVIRAVLPWLSRHMLEWSMITATLCIACVAYALFPLVRTVPLLATIAFLLGLGLGATQPSVMSLIYASAPPGRGGEALGVRSVVLNGSATILPLMFGGVSAALGMVPVFWSMAVTLASGAWFANRCREGSVRS
jgi:predicted MFS family arabinose efflux permease